MDTLASLTPRTGVVGRFTPDALGFAPHVPSSLGAMPLWGILLDVSGRLPRWGGDRLRGSPQPSACASGLRAGRPTPGFAGSRPNIKPLASL